MPNIARIKLSTSEFMLTGCINERLPAITDGLVAHYPFDGTITKYIPNQIRYIRDWLVGGSTANANNHWTELQVFDRENINIALNKIATREDGTICTRLTNNVINDSEWNNLGMAGLGTNYVTIDLGDLFQIRKIVVYHYAYNTRTYHGTKTEVSEDGEHWYSVFDSAIEGEYVENLNGHVIDLENLGTTCNPITNNTILTNDGISIEEGILIIPKLQLNNFSLAFKFNPTYQYYNVDLAPNSYNKIMLQMFDADYTRAINYTDWVSVPSTSLINSMPFYDLEPDSSWDSKMHHWHHNLAYIKNEWQDFFILKSGNTLRIYVVLNGTVLVDQTFTYADSSKLTDFILTELHLGVNRIDNWKGKFKNLSIYNRILTTVEMNKIIGNIIQLNSNGDLKTSKFIELDSSETNGIFKISNSGTIQFQGTLKEGINIT